MKTDLVVESLRYAIGDRQLGRKLASLIGTPFADSAWRRHVDIGSGSTSFGLSQVAWKDYRVVTSSGGQMPAYSMMEIAELALLYGLARERWTGAGEIVDLGPYTGLTTWSLAHGCVDNPSVSELLKYRRIHSYDLFVRADGSGDSVFPQVLELNAPFADYVQFIEGDILTERWSGAPIEILFVDLAKSEALQDHVVQQFFTCLRPGSILVQQDYVHYYHHWIHILMEHLSEYFVLEDLVYGASACYRLVRPLPDLSGWTLAAAVPPSKRPSVHRSHIDHSPAVARGALWCAHAKLLLDAGDLAGARKALSQVRMVPESDPVRDFRAIIPSNVESVRSLLPSHGPR